MTDKNALALEALTDDLLNDLDEIAREVCVHEYGLPLAHDEVRAKLRERVLASLSSAAPAAGEVALTELLEETRDTLVKVLLKIRRDAPDLSGKLMGHADNVVARFDAFLDAATPAPSATLLNGLTEKETSATASVAGLTAPSATSAAPPAAQPEAETSAEKRLQQLRADEEVLLAKMRAGTLSAADFSPELMAFATEAALTLKQRADAPVAEPVARDPLDALIAEVESTPEGRASLEHGRAALGGPVRIKVIGDSWTGADGSLQVRDYVREATEAARRVRKFIDCRKGMRGLDPNVIFTLTDREGGIHNLTVTDLAALSQGGGA